VSERLRLNIAIVHYRTPGLLLDCINSLREQIDSTRDRIIVVDNASPDGSAAQLRDIPGITLIESPKNLGFAGANNLAIAAADADFYLLLNPDTLVRPGAIATLLDFMARHPDAGLCGSRLEDPDGTPQVSAFGAQTPLSELIRGANVGFITRLFRRAQVYGPFVDREMPCDWLAGACLLVRRQVIQDIGLLDARYFMYFEEADFCRRAQKAGHPCWFVPSARVVHLVGQASGVTWQNKPLPAYWFESRHRYYRTHFGRFGVVAADTFYLIGRTIGRVRQLFTGKNHSKPAKNEVRDLLRHEAKAVWSPLPEPSI
jgi:N-acetylglucosaminyl-diphospho-decaprenol L-rhamnosyltransferase